VIVMEESHVIDKLRAAKKSSTSPSKENIGTGLPPTHRSLGAGARAWLSRRARTGGGEVPPGPARNAIAVVQARYKSNAAVRRSGGATHHHRALHNATSEACREELEHPMQTRRGAFSPTGPAGDSDTSREWRAGTRNQRRAGRPQARQERDHDPSSRARTPGIQREHSAIPITARCDSRMPSTCQVRGRDASARSPGMATRPRFSAQ